MAVDALAPFIARPSVLILLNMQNKEGVVLNKETTYTIFIWRNARECKYIPVFSEINSLIVAQWYHIYRWDSARKM